MCGTTEKLAFASLDRAHDNIIFEHEGHSDKYEIQDEHGETQAFVHLPAEACDEGDHADEHHEEDGD